METLYAYFAGFLDGEGTFTISKAYRGTRFDYFVVIQCGMADCEENRIVLQKLKDEFGGYMKVYPYKDKVRKKQRDLLFWRLTTRKARICAEKLLPYLIIKKKQAEIVIELAELQSMKRCKNRPKRLTDEQVEERNNLVKRVRLLNLRGMAAKHRQHWAAAETE